MKAAEEGDEKAFPMYVGMNRLLSLRRGGLLSVPHVRGDEPNAPKGWITGWQRSPCTWG